MNAALGHQLIFVISQPRSGSTLLQRVLGGHPEIQTSAETWLMLHAVSGRKTEGIEANYNVPWAVEAVDEFIANYTDGDEVYDNAVRAWASQIYDNALAKNGKTRFLDKTPRYFMIVPELARLFPQAKFILLFRNPMSVLASELTTYVKTDWNTLSLFAPDLMEAPQQLLDAEQLLGERAHRVQYEEFVSAPEKITAQLCDYLELDYSDGMVDYSSTPAPKGKMNDPVGIHQHSRPSAASLDKWKKLAEDPQNAHLAQSYAMALGDSTLAGMGYDLTDILTHLGETVERGSSVYPWELAITPRKDWTLGQQFRDLRYLADRGPLRGQFTTLRRIARALRVKIELRG